MSERKIEFRVSMPDGGTKNLHARIEELPPDLLEKIAEHIRKTSGGEFGLKYAGTVTHLNNIPFGDLKKREMHN